MKKVRFGIIQTGVKHMDYVIPCLLELDYKNLEIIILDQEDGKWSFYKAMKQKFPNAFDFIKVIKEKNLWHSGGHNKIINMPGEFDYYICGSNDMIFDSDLVSKLVAAAEKESDCNFLSCKILRWDFENNQKTKIIDSMGMTANKKNKFWELGQTEKDIGQYDDCKYQIGSTGAFFMISKKALMRIKYKNEYFDELIHYKNDVDFSYRMAWAGYKCRIFEDIVVYHDRFVKKWSQSPDWAKTQSLYGSLVYLYKNFDFGFGIKITFLTFFYWSIKIFYLLIISPKTTIPGIKKFLNIKKEVKNKKKDLFKKISAKNLAKMLK